MTRIESAFGVTFTDYGREGAGVLLSSGCGIGLALMDVLPEFRWFVDMDNYRYKSVDWEAIAVMLSVAGAEEFLLAGWFTFDAPVGFDRFSRGVLATSRLSRYEGGHGFTLGEFLTQRQTQPYAQTVQPID